MIQKFCGGNKENNVQQNEKVLKLAIKLNIIDLI
jgi:hypothetical protein